MKPPYSKTNKHGKERERKDKNPKLSCRVCGKRGLRYGSKTHICAECIRNLPYVVKTSGTTELPAIMRNYANAMIKRFGLELSSKLLKIDVPNLDALSRGQADLLPTPSTGKGTAREPTEWKPSPAGPDLPPEVIARVVEHYKEFRPLDPSIAHLVVSWRKPMRVEVARELPGPRRQRLNRAEQRAKLTRYVPRSSAPMDPSAPRNAFGRVDAVGRQRQSMSMRVCLGLWGYGFGAPVIARIAERARWPTSKSSVARMVKQAKLPFPGAEAVKIGDLTLEVCKRPVPRIMADELLNSDEQ